MHKKLLIKAFEKAEEEISSDKVFPRAQLLSDFIVNDSKEPYGEKILSLKYKSALNGSKETIRLKKHAEDALSHYLGYDDYLEFTQKNGTHIPVEERKSKRSGYLYKSIIAVVLVFVIGTVIYNYITRQRWMVWNENTYVEVNFDVNKYDVNQLKIFKEERIELFKKVTPHCEDQFFNANGSVKIWYGKNKEKELEYFTALGLHPETGKTLKPITQYMINKHICN
ncbi:hypothetical protein [Winogradskyella thalassocola]|uniref:Uncharacterized protein n=1 Tax=Winogradskyella thalassocola TaxID=262004 RepID=A0A1G8B8W4_9FLAO|nr:hypothetical protein [Winogradskyella thalassocola]SDH29637.1 hypothetical protein SAMN04489796_102183 [Winogradskyella thalassocola]